MSKTTKDTTLSPSPNLEQPLQTLRKGIDLLFDIRRNHMTEGDRTKLRPPKALYHYTTADGLRGIIENKCLHASAAFYMNDSSEMEYGCHLFSDVVLKTLYETSGISDTVKEVLNLTAEVFGNLDKLEETLANVYVACFCREENLLSQWRAYGQSGGYSIGFITKKLEETFNMDDEYYDVRLERVLYSEQNQSRILKELIHDVMKVLGHAAIVNDINDLSENGKSVVERGFRAMVRRIALEQIVRFKHPAFEEEQEWRLIVTPSLPMPDDEATKHINFKPLRGFLTPYVNLKPQQGSVAYHFHSIRSDTGEKTYRERTKAFA